MDAPETANAAQRKLLKLAHKRLERFVTLAPKFLVNDDPETIHDLRVSSRRLQQTIRSLSPSPQPARSRKLVKVLRRVRQALGSLRNLDVNSELARSRMKKAPSPVLRDSWQALADHLQKQRHALVGAARAEVAKYDGIQFIERAQKLLSHADLETDPIPALEKAVAESLSEWDENYALAMENRSVDHLHSLRIATKRLRYRAELLADIGAASLKPRVRDLKNIQSALGDWHDRSVLLQCTAEFIAAPLFLSEHPDLGSALLAQMEQEKKTNDDAITAILDRMPKLRKRWDDGQVKEKGT